jgi:type IV pilus assembly protein PilO
MEKSFGTMLRQLPNKTEVPNLLVDISQTGLAAGLEEQLFQPVGEIRKDFYAELPIKIRLTGDYHEMGAFASGIAALPRIVTLHDIEIKPEGKGGDGLLTLDVVAKTYRYLDDDEQGAQSEADDPKGNKKPARSKKPAKKKDAKSKGDSA